MSVSPNGTPNVQFLELLSIFSFHSSSELFRTFEIWSFELVSSFEFRASDLVWPPPALADSACDDQVDAAARKHDTYNIAQRERFVP
jgi:hypothetical protein